LTFLVGPEKRFWEITLREATPAVVQARIATQSELEEICSEMASVATTAARSEDVRTTTTLWKDV
jgi:hypothetical protein